MLHDMVAAHSIVRVSVCRANKGSSLFFIFFFSPTSTLSVLLLLGVPSKPNVTIQFIVLPDSTAATANQATEAKGRLGERNSEA